MSLINIHNQIFHSNTKAVNFLIENQIIIPRKRCVCGFLNELKINLRNGKETVIFRCRNINCRIRRSIFAETIFKNTKLELFEILLLLNLFMNNISNYAAVNLSGISDNTYIEFKEKMISIFNIIMNEEYRQLGGENLRVQVDETAICRGRIISNPSNSLDQIPGIVWMIGGINENDGNFFLKIIPNRQINTFTQILGTELAPKTVLVSDGYPSYPQAARNLNFTHLVVNHSLGFVNEEGDNTNSIENLWSHLKTEMRRRHGIRYDNWERFIQEFSFKKKYLSDKSHENFQRIFKKILFKIFN